MEKKKKKNGTKTKTIVETSLLSIFYFLLNFTYFFKVLKLVKFNFKELL